MSATPIFVAKHHQFSGEDSRFLVKLPNYSIAIIAYRGIFYAIDNFCCLHGCPLIIGDVEDISGKIFLLCPWDHHPISLQFHDDLPDRAVTVDHSPTGNISAGKESLGKSSYTFLGVSSPLSSFPLNQNSRFKSYTASAEEPRTADLQLPKNSGFQSLVSAPTEPMLHRIVVDGDNVLLFPHRDINQFRSTKYSGVTHSNYFFHVPPMDTPLEKAALLARCSIRHTSGYSLSQAGCSDATLKKPIIPYLSVLNAGSPFDKSSDAALIPYEESQLAFIRRCSSLQERKSSFNRYSNGLKNESQAKKNLLNVPQSTTQQRKNELNRKEDREAEGTTLEISQINDEELKVFNPSNMLWEFWGPIYPEEKANICLYCAQAGVNPLRYGCNPLTSSSGLPYFSELRFEVRQLEKVCKGTRELHLYPFSGHMERWLQPGEIVLFELRHGKRDRVSLVVIEHPGEREISVMVRLPERIVATTDDGRIVKSLRLAKSTLHQKAEEEDDEDVETRDGDESTFINERDAMDLDDEILLSTEHIIASSEPAEKRKSLQCMLSSLIYPKSKFSFLYSHSLLAPLLLLSCTGKFTLVNHMPLILECGGRVLWVSGGMGVCSAYGSLQRFFASPVALPHRFSHECLDQLTVVHVHVERNRKLIPKLEYFESWDDHHSHVGRDMHSTSASADSQLGTQTSNSSLATFESIHSFPISKRPGSTYVFHAFLTREAEVISSTSPHKSSKSVLKSFTSFSKKTFLPNQKPQKAFPSSSSPLETSCTFLSLPRFTFGRYPEKQDIQYVLSAYFKMMPSVVFVSGSTLFNEKYVNMLKELKVHDRYILVSPKIDGM